MTRCSFLSFDTSSLRCVIIFLGEMTLKVKLMSFNVLLAATLSVAPAEIKALLKKSSLCPLKNSLIYSGHITLA